MEVDRAVILLLAGRNLVWGGITGVVEASAIRKPGKRRGAHPRNAVLQFPATLDFEQVENALLVPVLRQAIRQEPAVPAREIPVQCRGARLIQSVGIYRDPVVTLWPVP